ncbi:MAG TPA: protein-disulfide reductase DsbD N-terminal domain-containing protein [Salinisphaeraceae bacterium]|nr:protein-disulfide reductase DsbD N-terminal domain-containing protein [Salinisphaeraceae bacterium]
MKHKLMLTLGILALSLAGASAALAQLQQSASKVEATATYDTEDAQQLNVQLDIADGWHVNANPASLEFLIPTSITAHAGDNELAPEVDWPAGKDSGIELGGTEIQVYDSDTEIPVQLDDAAAKALQAGQLELEVVVQACSDDGICLPPSTLNVTPSAS